MWKKVLAILSVPVWLFLLVWAIRAALAALKLDATTGRLVVFWMCMGSILVIIVFLLFFWGRWTWRILNTKRLRS